MAISWFYPKYNCLMISLHFKPLLLYFQFYTLKLNTLGLQCLKISIGFIKQTLFGRQVLTNFD